MFAAKVGEKAGIFLIFGAHRTKSLKMSCGGACARLSHWPSAMLLRAFCALMDAHHTLRQAFFLGQERSLLS
jgi:hypothetical protein